MPIGKPFLAVFAATDQTVRMYELAADGSSFQQIATTQFLHHSSAPSEPYLDFNAEGTRFLGIHQETATPSTSMRTTVWSRDLIEITELSLPATNDGIFKGFSSDKSDVIGGITGFNLNNYMKVQDNDTLANLGQMPYFGLASERAVALSSDDEYFFVGRSAGIHWVFPRTGTNPTYQTPVFTSGTVYTLGESTITPGAAAFSADSRFLLLGSQTTGVLEMFLTDPAGDFELVDSFDAGLGIPIHILSRFDSRYFAVTYKNGTVYTTRLYERFGGFLTVVQTIADFGQLLQISADGTLLVDAATKKARTWDSATNTFATNSDAIMANIAANATSAAISPHIDMIVPRATLYDNALTDIMLDTLDLANLKVMLLDDNADFVKDEEDMTNLTPNEVYGFGWTQGGEVIPNVIETEIASGVAGLTGDPVEALMIGGTLTFNKAVIYDATTNRPTVFIDFVSPRTANENYRFIMSPLTDGFVRIIA